MNLLRRILLIATAVLLCVTSVVGCAPEASQTPDQSSSPEATQSVNPTTTPEPTPTVDPTPTPEPTPTDAPVPIDAYFIIKDGKSLITLVHGTNETQSIIDEIEALRNEILKRCDILLPKYTDSQLSKIKTPKLVVGQTKISSYDRLGNEATQYDMLVELDGSDIYALGYTQGATLDAFHYILDNMVVMNDCKNVYIKPNAFGGLMERDLREYKSSWDEFTISGYGTPTFSTYDPDLWTEKDKATFQSIVDFGLSEVSVSAYGFANANFDIEAMKKYIEKFNSVGIKSRIYAFGREEYQLKDHAGNYNGGTKDYDALEACIKNVVETFGDIEGVAVWGFYDEPLQYDSFRYCNDVIELFNKYDEQQRPVYINMGPLAGQSWCSDPLEVYNKLYQLADPDFYCFDRYPFFRVDENGNLITNGDVGQPMMFEPYWYSNLEMNRNMGIDASRDTGIVIGSIVVGGVDGWNEGRADVDQDIMNWQINCALAYGYKYIEHFVFYTGHSHGLYTSNNDKTFRWDIAKNANDYANVVGNMIFNKKLDIVFHLENADGTYSPEVHAYKGFRNAGEVEGCDAILSFFEDGTIMVTDKRCTELDGGDHNVTLGGLNGGVEWFNVENNAWEDISTCEAAEVSEDGLTLTLTRASQFIVRAK